GRAPPGQPGALRREVRRCRVRERDRKLQLRPYPGRHPDHPAAGDERPPGVRPPAAAREQEESMTESNAPPIAFHELLRVLWRRRMLVIIPWAVALVTGVAVAVLLKPVYVSSVTMLMERPQQLTGNLGVVSGGVSPDAQADIMREQVQSSLFLSTVAQS